MGVWTPEEVATKIGFDMNNDRDRLMATGLAKKSGWDPSAPISVEAPKSIIINHPGGLEETRPVDIVGRPVAPQSFEERGISPQDAAQLNSRGISPDAPMSKVVEGLGRMPTQGAPQGERPEAPADDAQQRPAPMMGPTVIPGLSRQAAEQQYLARTGLSNIKPETAEKEAKAWEGLDRAQVEQAKIDAQGAGEVALISQKYQQELEQRNQAQQAQEAKRQEVHQDYLKSIQQKVDSYDDTTEIDPNRRWNNASTGTKIAMSVQRMALGYLAGYHGNPGFMQEAERATQQDIDAQKELISRKRDKIGLQRGMYSDLVQSGVDARSAELATKMAALDDFKAQLQAQVAKNSALQGNNNVAATMSQIDAQRAAYDKQMQVSSGQYIYQAMQPRMIAGAGPGMAELEHQNDLEVPALGGIAKNVEDAKMLREKTSNQLALKDDILTATGLRKGLDEYDVRGGIVGGALRGDMFHSDEKIAKRKQLENVVTQAQARMKEDLKAKRMSPEEATEMNNVLGNLLTGQAAPAVAAGKFAADRIDKDMVRLAQANGIKKAQSGYVRDQRGAVKEVTGQTGQTYRPNEKLGGPTVKTTKIGH